MRFLFVFFIVLSFQVVKAQCIEGDCFNGYGKFTCDCGYVFEGEFVNGERVYGTLTKSELVYTGEFKYEMAHGYGKVQYKDGSWYEGEFEENYPVGYGVYYISKEQKYIGRVVQNSYEGYGVLNFRNPDGGFKQMETGHFKDDLLNGVGFVQGSDSSYYLGWFKNGEKEGFGVKYYYHNQSYQIGDFHKNKVTETPLHLSDDGSNYTGPIKIKSAEYSIFGDQFGQVIFIKETIKYRDSRVIKINFQEKWIYISREENPMEGVVIQFSGEQYHAKVENNKLYDVIIGKPVFNLKND